MTEYEETVLKKIVKGYLIECIYTRLNRLAGQYGISNAEISKRIGWDPAGFNQKYNRNSDIRITTFIKIYVAMRDLVKEETAQYGYFEIDAEDIKIGEVITDQELEVGVLLNHISEVAEGKTEFLSSPSLIESYKSMRSFVLEGQKNKRFTQKETEVYVNYYRQSVAT